MIGATLFSGIGAPEQAMPGWHWAWHAEIEPFPAAVMAARHPQSINLGDVTAHDFCDRAAAIARPDVLVFGSPCQSFSVAGRRLGLDDPRGNLALVALGIVARLRPRWFVFENVSGLLSSGGGRDFGLFLRAVDDIRYHVAWAVLDAQHFGVAQRRCRVFAVGHAGDWRGPAAVLLEPARVRGDSPPRRGEGQAVASGLGAGSPRSGQRVGRREAAGGQLIAHFQARGSNLDLSDDVTGSIGTNSDRASGSAPCIAFHARQDPDSGPVTHPLDTDGCSIAVAYGFEDRYRGDDGRGHDREPSFSAGVAPTMSAIKPPAVAYGIGSDAVDRSGEGASKTATDRAGLNIVKQCQPALRARPNNSVAVAYGGNNTSGSIDLASALSAHGGSHGRLDFESETFVMPILESGKRTGASTTDAKAGAGIGDAGDPMFSLGTDSRHAVAFAENSRAELRLEGGDGKAGQSYPAIAAASAVRRLTPRECERLQGFSDNYTLIRLSRAQRKAVEVEMAEYYRRTCQDISDMSDDELRRLAADGPRYKALGNSMAAPVLRWILSRIEAVDLITRAAP